MSSRRSHPPFGKSGWGALSTLPLHALTSHTVMLPSRPHAPETRRHHALHTHTGRDSETRTSPPSPRPLTHTTHASSTTPQVFTQIFTAETHTQQGVTLVHSFNARDITHQKVMPFCVRMYVCACGALPDDTEGISAGTSGCLAIKSCPQPRPQACKYGVRVNLGRANESLRSFPLFSIMCFASVNSRQSPITRFTTIPR